MVQEVPDADRGDHHQGHGHQVQADDLGDHVQTTNGANGSSTRAFPSVQHADELPRGCAGGQILAEQRLTGVRQRREEPEYEGGHPDLRLAAGRSRRGIVVDDRAANGTGIVQHRVEAREATVTETTIAFTELLGRRVRMGPWEDQKVSTYRKIIEALDGARWDEAAHARRATSSTRRTSASRSTASGSATSTATSGTRASTRRVIKARNDQAVAVSRPARRVARGTRASSGTASSPRSRTFTAATYREQPDEAKRRLDVMKETWRQCHDRDVDHTYALMSLIKEQLGEAADPRHVRPRPAAAVRLALREVRRRQVPVGRVARDPHARRLRGDARPPRRPRADRRHGAGRARGPLRPPLRPVRLRADGRLRGDSIEGTPPRMQPPYDWKVTEEPHTWNHNTPGVCLYCTHCIILMEEMPMDRFGYPVRVVDPPVYDAEHTAVGERRRSASGRCSRTRPRCPRSTTRASGGRSRPRSVRRPAAPASSP